MASHLSFTKKDSKSIKSMNDRYIFSSKNFFFCASYAGLAALCCSLITDAFAQTPMPKGPVSAATLPLSAKTTARNQSKKQPKTLNILDRAWQQKDQSLIKKLTFVEQLQKDLETQFHTAENQSRLLLAQSVVLLSEQDTQLAAVELIRRAAQTYSLQISLTAAKTLWGEFQKTFGTNNGIHFNALADVAWALSTSGHDDLDENWSFFRAIDAKRRSNRKEALLQFSKMQPNSSLYRQTKLQEGLLLAGLGDTESAKRSLEVVLSLATTPAEKNADLSSEALINIKERAALNLARLQYEDKDYKEALALYRTIDSQSPLFYESLSEQGWAFFRAGYPNRALGVEYGASSPFFSKQFQPDLYFLRAAVNYWLCDLSASRQSIQSFALHSKDEAALLRKWTLSEKTSDAQQQTLISDAYRVADHLFRGVTSANNSLGPKSLNTVAQNQTLIRLFKNMEELRRQRTALQQSNWPLRIRGALVQSLVQREDSEQKNMGRLVLSMIQSMRTDYERALEQLKLIQIEIMTAEKDKLMAKQRSAVGQQFTTTEEQFMEAALHEARVWNDEKREFWKDELDGFVFRKKSQCQQFKGEVSQNDQKQ